VSGRHVPQVVVAQAQAKACQASSCPLVLVREERDRERVGKVVEKDIGRRGRQPVPRPQCNVVMPARVLHCHGVAARIQQYMNATRSPPFQATCCRLVIIRICILSFLSFFLCPEKRVRAGEGVETGQETEKSGYRQYRKIQKAARHEERQQREGRETRHRCHNKECYVCS